MKHLTPTVGSRLTVRAVVVLTPLLLVLASGFASQPGQDAPEQAATELPVAHADCSVNLLRARPSGPALWHTISSVTERLAASSIDSNASSTTARRRGAAPPVLPPNFIQRRNFIDDEIFGKMAADGIRPTVLAPDEEFLRRVTLDLTGEIPDSDAVKAFLADKTSDKRDRVIDKLLASDAFVDRWTMWFGDLVQNVQAATNSREYYQGRNAYYNAIRASIKGDTPYDQMVREFLAGQGDNFLEGRANYVVRQMQPNGPIQDTYDNLATHSGEKFLGMPLQCLSCHSGARHLELVNGYLATRKRTDFWKLAAFFAQTNTTVISDPSLPNGTRKYNVGTNPTGSYRLNTTSGNKTPRQPASGEPSTVTPAFFLTGEVPAPSEPLREAYGRFVTTHAQFARASVNYLWKEIFHLGIVEPVDSFDLLRLDPTTLAPGSTLQPTHPRLLSLLADSFKKGSFSLRAILRTMVVSSTYQLSTRYTPEPWQERWTPYFARHLARRLPAEMMLDAIIRATGVPATFNVTGLGPVGKAMGLPDTTELGNSAPYGSFLNTFGRGNRDDEPRTEEGSIPQVLALLDDSLVTSRIRQSTTGSTVQNVLRTTSVPAEIVDALYLTTLSRHPSPAESAVAVAYLRSGDLARKTEDLDFALLNKLEFLFN